MTETVHVDVLFKFGKFSASQSFKLDVPCFEDGCKVMREAEHRILTLPNLYDRDLLVDSDMAYYRASCIHAKGVELGGFLDVDALCAKIKG